MPLDRCFLLEKQFIINVTDAEESRNKFARLPHLAYYLIIIISNTPEKGVQGHIKWTTGRYQTSQQILYSGELLSESFKSNLPTVWPEENCVQRRILRPNTKETHTPRARKKSTYRQWSTQAYVMSQSNFHFILSPSLLSVFDSNRTRHCSYCSVWTQCACCALRRRLL